MGTTIITTTVSEVQYRDITTVQAGGGVTLTLVDATLHDFYYQQVSRNRAGSAIIRSLHYIVIRTPTGDINTYPAQGGAIDAIEGYIQDSSTLWIDLIQGTSTPVTFTSTAQLPTGSYSVMGDLGSQREESTYQFTPFNNFTISTATINGQPADVPANGIIDTVENDDVRPWAVTFSRNFLGVPQNPTVPDFTPGPYIRQNDQWRMIEYAGGATVSGASVGNYNGTVNRPRATEADAPRFAIVEVTYTEPNTTESVVNAPLDPLTINGVVVTITERDFGRFGSGRFRMSENIATAAGVLITPNTNPITANGLGAGDFGSTASQVYDINGNTAFVRNFGSTPVLDNLTQLLDTVQTNDRNPYSAASRASITIGAGGAITGGVETTDDTAFAAGSALYTRIGTGSRIVPGRTIQQGIYYRRGSGASALWVGPLDDANTPTGTSGTTLQRQSDWDVTDVDSPAYIVNKPILTDFVSQEAYAGDISALQNVNTVQDLQIANRVSTRTDNLTLLLSTQDIAAGFGALPSGGRFVTRTFDLSVNNQVAIRVTAHGIPHTSNADYEFSYAAMNGWTLTNSPLASTSRGLSYDGPDIFVDVSNTNSVYATQAQIDVLKQAFAAATSFDDVKSIIANL